MPVAGRQGKFRASTAIGGNPLKSRLFVSEVGM